MKVAFAWASFGPYHHARLKATAELLGATNLLGIQISNCSSTYDWAMQENGRAAVVSVFKNIPAEQVPVMPLFFRLLKILRRERPEVCFVPSYWPASSAAVLFAARLCGCKCVMMNETHGGTASASGCKHRVKQLLLKLFQAGLVGGTPHREYFLKLGFTPENLFPGYDAVDNDYFRGKAETLKTEMAKAETRSQYDLPEHYFLSLGRFVPKKNLVTLIQAYRKYLDSNPDGRTHLVMVGSGEEDPKLRALCNELRLPVYDKTNVESGKVQRSEVGLQKSVFGIRHSAFGNELPGVHFYGFRQLEENPIFYALADAFILPSLWEEWGLVVNEAMACGLPVIVSQTAGCAEDLVREGVNGFTFDPCNVEQLARLLVQLSAFQPVRLSEFGDASREIISHWGCDNFANNAVRAAQAALGRKGS